MQVSIETTQGLERKMTVEIPSDRVQPAFEKRLKEMSRHVRMDGFRPGKVPMRVVRQRFGRQVREDVLSELVRDTYFEALKEQDVHPVGEPRIELKEEDESGAAGYTATFEVMPEIKIGELSGAVIKRPRAEVVEADIDRMIERLREQRSEWVDVQRAAADGDQVEIDFKGFIDGEAFEGGSAEGVALELGSGRMVDGFESGLVGASADEEREVEVTFPEDYKSEEVAGKQATFKVKVSKVQEKKLPEVDDEFCQAFGVEEGGLEALRKDVAENMRRELGERIQSRLKEQAMDALLNASDIEVPASMVQQESVALRDRTLRELGGAGAQQMELPLHMFQEQATKRVRLGLLIGEVIRAQELKVDADRVKERIQSLASSYENPQEVIDFYYSEEHKEQLSSVEGVVLEDQVADWVLSQAAEEVEETDFYTLMGPEAA